VECIYTHPLIIRKKISRSSRKKEIKLKINLILTQKIKQKRIREVSDEAQIRSVSQPDKKRKPLLGCSNE
jgi:hypothetical protein